MKEALAKFLDHSIFCYKPWRDRFIRFVVYFNKMRAEKNPVALGMIAHYCYENYFNTVSKIIIYKSNTTSFSSMLEKNATLKFKLRITSSFIYNQSSPMSQHSLRVTSLSVFSSFCVYIEEA